MCWNQAIVLCSCMVWNPTNFFLITHFSMTYEFSSPLMLILEQLKTLFFFPSARFLNCGVDVLDVGLLFQALPISNCCNCSCILYSEIWVSNLCSVYFYFVIYERILFSLWERNSPSCCFLHSMISGKFLIRRLEKQNKMEHNRKCFIASNILVVPGAQFNDITIIVPVVSIMNETLYFLCQLLWKSKTFQEIK